MKVKDVVEVLVTEAVVIKDIAGNVKFVSECIGFSCIMDDEYSDIMNSNVYSFSKPYNNIVTIVYESAEDVIRWLDGISDISDLAANLDFEYFMHQLDIPSRFRYLMLYTYDPVKNIERKNGRLIDMTNKKSLAKTLSRNADLFVKNGSVEVLSNDVLAVTVILNTYEEE